MDSAGAGSEGQDPPEVPAAEIRTHLTRVLAGGAFGSAPTLSRLLTYLVERALNGESPPKEYTIGVQLFGRGSDFDPRTDTIVRVHARRLRQRLGEYYAQEGRSDLVRLSLPKGHYALEARFAAPVSEPALLDPDGQPAIVVLPFVNVGGGSDTEYFADGLTDEITSALASVAGLHVVARTSAFQFKGRGDDVRHIGRVLGVPLALEGSVRCDGPSIRVHVQLIDVHNGFFLWAQTYERALPSAFRIQDEIAAAILVALRERLGLGGSVRSVAPTNAVAYECYLKGRYFWSHGSPDDVGKAVLLFEEAIARDATYAAAYAALADAYIYLATLTTDAPGPLIQAGRRAAAEALALQDLAEGHSAMGAVLGVGDWNWAGAEHEFRRALELMPSFAHARGAYAVCCLAPMRRHDEAIEQLRLALAHDPLSVFLRSMLGQILLLAGRFEDALRELRDALELEPNHIVGTLTRGWVLIGAGDFEGAVAALQETPESARTLPNFAGHLGHALGRLGHRAAAERLLADLRLRFQGPWTPAVDLAAICAGLGDFDTAREWLRRAEGARSFDVVFARDDPRFAEMWRSSM